MPAILPIVAGAAGSALLSKLMDAISNAGSTPAIDEGSSVAGAGRVYDAGTQPVIGNAQPSIVIMSPNAEGTQSSIPQNAPTAQTASQNVTAAGGNTAIDPEMEKQLQAELAADKGNTGGNVATAEDPASSPINGSDVLNALLAAAGASVLGYAGSRVVSNNQQQGTTRVEPTMDTPNAQAASKALVKSGGNAPTSVNNVIDAQFTPVNDPLNIAGGDSSLQLAAPQQKLNAPQPQQGTQEISNQTGNKALPPAQNKAINLPDQTSGPTIAAESGVFDAARPSQKINLQGKQYVVQDGMIFDGRTKSLIGEASKFIPKSQQGVARTLGILKRGLR